MWAESGRYLTWPHFGLLEKDEKGWRSEYVEQKTPCSEILFLPAAGEENLDSRFKFYFP